jgi:L-Ala-D/L-Glu epimerase
MRSWTSLHDVHLVAPLRPAAGMVAGGGRAGTNRQLIVFTIEAADGVVGYGEAAPLEEYDGVSVDRVMRALATHTSVLAMTEWPAGSDVRAACAEADPLPQALAAVDLALWDLAGRRAGVPVAKLIGAEELEPIRVNATIGAVAPAAAAQEALRALEAGFGAIKVKVGTPDDRQRLKAVRDAVGPDMLIRVDADGAWNQIEARAHIDALGRFDIELFEEPVHGVKAIQAVTRAVAGASLALDETARDAIGLGVQRACDAVCLKISDSGGITGLIAEARSARQLGYEVYIASTLDGPLGIAAALHAAAVVKPDRHCGLATLDRFDRSNPLPAAGGHMRVPAGPGLGSKLIDWYLQQR